MDKDLLRLREALSGALAGLSSSQTQATPKNHPEKWSIQQVVEHLLRTHQTTVPAIQARIDKRYPTRTRPSLRQRAGQFVVIALGRMPRGRQAPAAVSPALPAKAQSGLELTARVERELGELDRVTAEGEGFFGRRRAVSHMLFGPMSMQQWRRFHMVHGLHHVRQIQAIRREHGF